MIAGVEICKPLFVMIAQAPDKASRRRISRMIENWYQTIPALPNFGEALKRGSLLELKVSFQVR